MDPAELIKQIRAALGLPDDTADDALIERCKALVAAADKADKPPTDQTTAAASQIDLTKYVPMDVHLAVASQLVTLQSQSAAGAAAQAVDAAVTAGKVTPAMRPWALAMASQSLTDFAAYVDKAPVLVATANQTSASAPPPPLAPSGKSLTAEQLAVANQLGIATDAYAKALQETTR